MKLLKFDLDIVQVYCPMFSFRAKDDECSGMLQISLYPEIVALTFRTTTSSTCAAGSHIFYALFCANEINQMMSI